MQEFRTLILASVIFEKSYICWSISSNPPHNLTILSNSLCSKNEKTILWWQSSLQTLIFRDLWCLPACTICSKDVLSLWNYRFGGYHLEASVVDEQKKMALSGENGISLGMKPRPIVSAVDLAVSWKFIWSSSQSHTTAECHLTWSLGEGCSLLSLCAATKENMRRVSSGLSKAWLEFFRSE